MGELTERLDTINVRVRGLVDTWTERLEQHGVAGYFVRTWRRFRDIEGRHLALVIAMNLFIAIIPALIIAFAIVVGFNPHRTIGTILVDNFHLSGRTATVVRNTFPNARSGRSVALSISVISLLITGFDVSSTVQTAFARAFGVTPLKGMKRYVRGGGWLLALFTTTCIGFTLRFLVATRPSWVVAIALPLWLAMEFGFFLISPRLLLELPFKWKDLVPGAAICAVVALAVNSLISFQMHRWLSEYGNAYGSFGVSLAIVAAVGIIATFWVWIASALAVYWQQRAGSEVVAEIERVAASHEPSPRH